MLQKCKLLGLLTPFQVEGLTALAAVDAQVPGSYWRPKALGAYRGSHHAKTLQALCQGGYAERRAAPAGPGATRPSFEYRITQAGWEGLGVFKLLNDVPLEAVPGRAVDASRVRLAQRLTAGGPIAPVCG